MVLSIIPLVSLLLAVVDMDLERKQSGAAFSPVRVGAGGSANGNQAPARVPVARIAQNGANGANAQQGQGGFKFPFARRDNVQTAQPKDAVSGVRTMLYDPDKQLMQIP